ncbi:MAG: histidine phosphatase family protein [Gemmatimonadota bacterium]|nr:histidine phosphatase family protein [Gemmatimonadota bacterium]MDH5758936.1 histidine phosphatase family protein [Gemmatimonadota bacterium]
MKNLRLLSAAVVALTAGGCNALADGAASSTDAPVVVYLVRHAERAEDGTNDPPLSPEGEARAALLATLLSDAGITHVHSTDLKRTRGTGAPFTAASGLDVEVYDPRDLPGFAERLRATPGRHLVLGHSNTTPDLVGALGGAPGDPISEMEYDRFYVVTIPAAGPVSTVLLRFGAAYVEMEEGGGEGSER